MYISKCFGRQVDKLLYKYLSDASHCLSLGMPRGGTAEWQCWNITLYPLFNCKEKKKKTPLTNSPIF